jgi:hypothetical protein
LGWRVAGCSPEWASGGEEFGDGEEASGGADKRSPMGFFRPERISGRRGSLRCCQLCRRKTEGVGRRWARAEEEDSREKLAAEAVGRHLELKEAATRQGEGGSADLWLGLQQGAKEVAGDGEVRVGSAASGKEAKWATVWRRKRSREWLLALPMHEDKHGGTCGAGWPAATGGTAAEASHRCECGHHGMTAQKAGARGSSIGWNGYEPFGLLPSEPRPTFQFLPNFNLAPTLKFKNTAFPRSKSTQTLYDARHENFKQLYLLTELQIPTGYHVINFGSNSNLNIPWILKGFKPCEKSSKFTKILSWLLIHKSEFSCAHLYAINWSLYTSAHMTSFGNKEKSLNLKLKRNQTWISFKALKLCTDMSTIVNWWWWFRVKEHYFATWLVLEILTTRVNVSNTNMNIYIYIYILQHITVTIGGLLYILQHIVYHI